MTKFVERNFSRQTISCYLHNKKNAFYTCNDITFHFVLYNYIYLQCICIQHLIELIFLVAFMFWSPDMLNITKLFYYFYNYSIFFGIFSKCPDSIIVLLIFLSTTYRYKLDWYPPNAHDNAQILA